MVPNVFCVLQEQQVKMDSFVRFVVKDLFLQRQELSTAIHVTVVLTPIKTEHSVLLVALDPILVVMVHARDVLLDKYLFLQVHVLVANVLQDMRLAQTLPFVKSVLQEHFLQMEPSAKLVKQLIFHQMPELMHAKPVQLVTEILPTLPFVLLVLRDTLPMLEKSASSVYQDMFQLQEVLVHLVLPIVD